MPKSVPRGWYWIRYQMTRKWGLTVYLQPRAATMLKLWNSHSQKCSQYIFSEFQNLKIHICIGSTLTVDSRLLVVDVDHCQFQPGQPSMVDVHIQPFLSRPIFLHLGSFQNPGLRFTKLFYHSFLFHQSFSLEKYQSNKREQSLRIREWIPTIFRRFPQAPWE